MRADLRSEIVALLQHDDGSPTAVLKLRQPLDRVIVARVVCVQAREVERLPSALLSLARR